MKKMTPLRLATDLALRWGGMLLVTALISPALEAQTATPTVIRIWGHGHRGQDYIQTLLTAWQDDFRKTHPNIRFEDNLYGNASGIGALFTDVAELAILDREASFIEVDAFQQGTGHNPFAIAVAQGKVATAHHAPALNVYVNRENPLTQLSLQQLDAILDADHRLGPQAYKTWADAGVQSELAQHPIQIYMKTIQSADVQFLERAAMKGSQKFSCCLKLFSDEPGALADAQIAAAVARDRYGLGISSSAAPALKPVALSAGEAGPFAVATPATISAGAYPLARTVYLYADRKPNQPLSAEVAAFLAYVVSPAGQAVVARAGGYLPLSPALLTHAREVLQ